MAVLQVFVERGLSVLQVKPFLLASLLIFLASLLSLSCLGRLQLALELCNLFQFLDGHGARWTLLLRAGGEVVTGRVYVDGAGVEH